MSSQALLNLLIQTSEKAWRSGGGMGASSGLGGHGRGKGPGSRGGHFWINSSGHVEYGAKPSGARGGGNSKAPAKVTAITSSRRRAGLSGADVRRTRANQPGQRAVARPTAGGSGHAKVGELRAGYRIKPQTAAGKLQGKKRMLSEMDKVIRTGKDPHGNALSADSLHQLNLLATGLRTEIRMAGGAGKKEVATKAGGPGSRGGQYWLDQNGKVNYGPPPLMSSRGHTPKKGSHGTTIYSRVGRQPNPNKNKKAPAPKPGSGKKPVTSAQADLNNKHKLLQALNKTYRTGTDPAGNALSQATLTKINLMRAMLSKQLSGRPAPSTTRHKETKADAKIAKVMGEFKKGKLNTGSPKGPKVTNPKQAIAIALSQAAKVSRGKKKETDPGGSFTVFKDRRGAWRWVAVSSSGFMDRDGETVSTKALAEDAARCDATGSYGPLDWWHTDVVIGECDFNAMHGKLLVESGTFNNPLVAQRLAQAIAAKEFEAGVSLQFRHREPGPHVLPGRVFKSIYKERRALLPVDAASNIATRLEVISPIPNPATTGQKSIEVYKVDAIKEQKLIELFGQDVAKEYLSKLAQKEQEFIAAGTAYKAAQLEVAEKAAAALDAPMGADKKAVINAAPMAQADTAAAPVKTAKKDDLEGVLEPGGDNPMEDMAEGEAPEGDYEDSPTDQEADAILETLFSRIGQIVNETVKAKVDEILSAVNGLGAASTKEIAAQEGIAIALKETATALTKVTGENTALKEKVTALETRLNALDGTQPPVVRARASQQQGVTFKQLEPALRQLVNEENAGQDPYQGNWALQAAAQMTGSIAQRWQQS